ncbi:hypothetical protein AgCh_019488 [Apium graveolens]
MWRGKLKLKKKIECFDDLCRPNDSTEMVSLACSSLSGMASSTADEIYKRPVIIYNYPKELKPFYVRLNDDGKTVAAFDLIVPKYEWYLDLRRHGTVKNSGFSFVFDLLVLYATGLNDVRDVVPFSRSFGKAYN